MKPKELINCPLCTSPEVDELFDLNCGNFDNSTLYPSLHVRVCPRCGHIYNRLSSDEIVGLEKYYNEEYAPTNIGATDTTGDRPGSANRNTVERYRQLHAFISEYVTADSRVLDVGCAMGGFLDYLRAKGLSHLSGIDPTIDYVNYARRSREFAVKPGRAESIPFEDNSFDLLVMDQVLEHSVEPAEAFREARRVLVDGGVFCIGIPDAARYRETYFFDFFWFLMREHLQHFDLEHLKMLAARNGFELISSWATETYMMSDKMILPNLNALFRLTPQQECDQPRDNGRFALRRDLEQYVAEERARLEKKKALIGALIESRRPVYAWGIGREFLYLYEAAGLKHCNIAGLIDANPHKRGSFTLEGARLVDSSALRDAAPNSVLVISAIAHTEAIRRSLGEIGCRCEVLDL